MAEDESTSRDNGQRTGESFISLTGETGTVDRRSEEQHKTLIGVTESRYRRWLLYCLYLYATPMTLPDVAHQLAVWDPHVDEDDYLQERLRIYNSLYHDHLPEVCEVGLVDYSQHDDMIDLGPVADDFESVVTEEFSTEITELLAEERATLDTQCQP